MSESLWSPDLYMAAYRFAANAHLGQKVPGTDVSYIMHLSFVAMETMTTLAVEPKNNPDLAVQCAVLHDVIEDTDVTYEDVAERFGVDVADGVLALTKDKDLPTKAEQMEDSLNRLVQQPYEVQMVKLADRICNLAPPPDYWKDKKRRYYQKEAGIIYDALHPASPHLSARLTERIANYSQYFT